MYRFIYFLLVCIPIQSSACIDNPQAFRNSFLHRMLTPSNNSVFSRKQWAITTGVFGVTLATFGIWKYYVRKKVNSKPIEEKKESITTSKVDNPSPRPPKFNAVTQLAIYYKFRSNESMRRVWNECFNEHLKRGEVDLIQESIHVKGLLSYVPEDFFRRARDSKGDQKDASWCYNISEGQDGTRFDLMTTIQDGKIVELSTCKSFPPNKVNMRKVVPIFCYNTQTISLLNQVMQALDKKSSEQFNPECTLITNYLSIVSGIQNNKKCTDIDKKEKDIGRVKKGFKELIGEKSIAQQEMIEEVKFFFENQEINKVIFNMRFQSQAQNHVVTTRMKQELTSSLFSVPITATYDVEIRANQGKITHLRRTNLKLSAGPQFGFAKPLYQSDAFIALVNNVCEAIDNKNKIQLANTITT